MLLSKTEARWIEKFGEARPGALWLGGDYIAARHLRIHSLPMSKRYAQSDEERDELFSRHRIVSKKLLGEGSQCFAFYSCRSGFAELDRLESLSDHDLQFRKRDSLGYGDEVDKYEVFSAPMIWSSRTNEKFLMAIADDELSKLTFANLEHDSIYEPYDGGADLIFMSEQSMLDAREAWTYWLSSREDGR